LPQDISYINELDELDEPVSVDTKAERLEFS
jgi:hypothetical protein